MGQFVVFDENVMPKGCDPNLFALTFEMRSNRYEIEQYVNDTKKKVKSFMANLDTTIEGFEIIEDNLRKIQGDLEKSQVRKIIIVLVRLLSYFFLFPFII